MPARSYLSRIAVPVAAGETVLFPRRIAMADDSLPGVSPPPALYPLRRESRSNQYQTAATAEPFPVSLRPSDTAFESSAHLGTDRDHPVPVTHVSIPSITGKTADQSLPSNAGETTVQHSSPAAGPRAEETLHTSVEHPDPPPLQEIPPGLSIDSKSQTGHDPSEASALRTRPEAAVPSRVVNGRIAIEESVMARQTEKSFGVQTQPIPPAKTPSPNISASEQKGVPALASQPPRIHIGTVEVRVAPQPVPASQPPALPVRLPASPAAPLTRSLDWRYGLIQS